LIEYFSLRLRKILSLYKMAQGHEPDFQLFSSLRYDPLLLSIPKNTEHWDSSSSIHTTGSPFYMLPYHRDRMLFAAQNFHWTTAFSTISGPTGFSHLLSKLSQSIGLQSTTPLRVRILLDFKGEITIETNPVPETSKFNLFPARLPPPRSSQPPPLKLSPLTGGALTLGPQDEVHGDPPREEVWTVVPDTTRTASSEYTTYKTTTRSMYNSARERIGLRDGEKKEVLILSEKEGEVMEGSLTSCFFWREGKWVTPPVESGGQAGTTRRWALERGLCVEGVVRVDELVDGEECWISNGVKGFMLGNVKLS